MADKSRALLSFDNVRNVKITPTAAKPAEAAKPAASLAVAYRLLSENGETDKKLPANDVKLVFS